MKNTIKSVIEVLENKGYTVEQAEENRMLEVISPAGVVEDITPSFVNAGAVEDLPISEFINEDTRNICFEFYGWTLNFPTAKELITEIEKVFK
ncbi:hypothetical protein HOR18_gp016 [Staphylococcus phage vB_SscM-1]|uniref:Uncharacterized protein n=2 Tax=Sciuriunavirus SscM1 TaxID=2734053 RepID=A0A1X9I9N6_9CAUD|nr:hypothetical protein HOR18_gp016 [Staphylococcus phage vB_SscM-1]ANT44679.1 hypothetical protein vB_SscM-1_016 [Staphylococcus phage vB_SscM-1]ANT44882.1 hypothetical protein vB_SscM-2_015 [Staphylococcus phage vB_SscM-2]